MTAKITSISKGATSVLNEQLPTRLVDLLTESFNQDRFVSSHHGVIRGSKLVTAGFLKILSLIDSVAPPLPPPYAPTSIDNSQVSKLSEKERRSKIRTIEKRMKGDPQLVGLLVRLKRIEALLTLANRNYYHKDNAEQALEYLYEAFGALSALLGEDHDFTLSVAAAIHEIHLAEDELRKSS